MDQAELNEAMNLKGFLSPSMEFVRERLKSFYDADFMAAESASEDAQRSMIGAGINREEPHMLAALVFLQRTIRSCQAAIILCERGLVVDAQTVTRAAVESLFHGVALIKDHTVFQRIARSGDVAERKQAVAMINSLKGFGLTEQNIRDLEEVIRRDDGQGPELSTHDAARIADLMPLYDTFYRGLSGVASHATFRSMDSSFAVTDEGWALITGPTDQHLAFTLGLAKTCLDIARRNLDESFIFG